MNISNSKYKSNPFTACVVSTIKATITKEFINNWTLIDTMMLLYSVTEISEISEV